MADNQAVFSGFNLSEFPLVTQWVERMKGRPAVQKGLGIPVKADLKALAQDENFIAGNRELIRQAMEEDKKRNVKY